ncbi:MAG: sialate O-acetylesterase [Terrimicrobiaceae bacterium]|nr:sialate O-acetylesterase [Terrimicrobiaceae bacterium]
MKHRHLIILPWLVLNIHAAVSVHPLISDGCILQRDVEVPVWGEAEPGTKVEVVFAGQTVGCIADENGRWLVRLQPMAASGESRDLIVRGPTELTIRDVVVGDVWVLSGQSNMASPMSSGSAAEALPNAEDPLLRSFNVAKNVAARPLFAPTGKWEPSTPVTAQNFSAVGYFFARELRKSQNVPIGIINASWGGTPIRTWMSLASLQEPPPSPLLPEWERAIAKHEAAGGDAGLLQAYYQDRKEWEEKVDKPFREARKAWELAVATAKATGEPPPPAPQIERPKPESPDPLAMPAPGTSDRPSAPTGCYNAMIASLIPFAIKGALWYQGEADASRGLEYRDHLKRLISGWRSSWSQGDFPFLIIQLPGNGKDPEPVAAQGIAWLREAQAMARSLPATGLIVTSDIGDASDVHPDNKQFTGERAALVAREIVYKEPVVGVGPRFMSSEVNGNQIKLLFTNTGNGLVIGQAPWVAKSAVPIPIDRLLGFFIAGEDKKWHEAEARIEGDSVIVSSPAAPAPVAVRYAWANTPRANLYNKDGLPAEPFRTDDWPR